MKYLLIPLLCVLAASKVTLQSRFSKMKSSGLSDNIFFNGLMFLTVALIFTPFLVMNGATSFTVICGIIMGVLSTVFQIFYISAFSAGKMSLTVIINNFSMLIPMTVSLFLFGERLSILKITGTALALCSFVLSVAKDKSSNDSENAKRANIKWLIFIIIVFFSNGIATANQKIYSMYTLKLQVFEFVAVSYITASVLSFLILIFSAKRSGFTCKKQPKVIISGLLVGLLLGTFQCVNTYAASIIDGTILYSAFNCGASILSALIGRVLFKEKLSAKQYAGVFLGIAAIVLLCL